MVSAYTACACSEMSFTPNIATGSTGASPTADMRGFGGSNAQTCARIPKGPLPTLLLWGFGGSKLRCRSLSRSVSASPLVERHFRKYQRERDTAVAEFAAVTGAYVVVVDL